MIAVPLNLCGDDVMVRVLNKYHPQAITVNVRGDADTVCRIIYDEGVYILYENGQKNRVTDTCPLFGGARSTYTVAAGNIRKEYTGSVYAAFFNEEKEAGLILKSDIEDYTAGVLCAETGSEYFSPESAKALSVVIRTYIYENRGRHGVYDVCDLAHCQVFSGVAPGMEKCTQAAYATRGEILISGKKEKRAFFSACCGGVFEHPENIWRRGKSAAAADEADGEILCSRHEDFEWKTELPAGNINRVLKNISGRGMLYIRRAEITGRTPGNRARKITFHGIFGKKTVPANRFISSYCSIYGWKEIPSALFGISRKAGGFVLKGRGFGHGAGLCMAGARRLAEKGYNYREILRHYFPDVKVGIKTEASPGS